MSKLKNIFIKVLTSVFLLTVVLLQNNAVSAAGSWDYVESMSNGRSYIGVAELNGKIYVAGGEINGRYSNKFEEYDPLTDAWTQKANLPTTRECLGLASANGRLYAIGGDGARYSGYRVDEYDPSTNTWVNKKSMTTSRSRFATSVVNNKIYIIGGYSSGNSNLVTEYDPSTDTWKTKASMPTARQSCTSAVINNKIYVMGGSNNTPLKTVEIYDPATDSWSTASNMLTSRNCCASVAYDGKILVMGGYGLNSTEEYDSVSNTWTAKENMQSIRYSFGSAVVNRNIYAIGGSYNLNTVETYTLPTLPPNAVNNFLAVSDSTSITLTWDEVANAESYSIELDGTTVVNNITDTSYSVTGLTPSTQHSYKIKAVNVGGESEWSSPVSMTTLPIPPSIPVNGNATASATEITLVWDAVDGADSYSIELDGTTVVNNITDTSYTVTGLTPSTVHCYKIKAVNAGGESEWSSPVSMTTLPIPPLTPVNLNATASSTEITLVWDAVDGADSYSIELDGTSVVNNVTTNSYTVSGLTSGTQHSYKIKAINAGGESEWSAPLTSTTILLPPTIPTNIVATGTSTTEITLSWDAVDGATGYELMISNEIIDVGSNTFFVLSNLDNNSAKFCYIRAKNSAGSSEWSPAIVGFTLPTPINPPTNITYEFHGDYLYIYWDGARFQDYKIEFDGELYSISETMFVIGSTSFKSNSTFSFRIKAKKCLSESDWSEYYYVTIP